MGGGGGGEGGGDEEGERGIGQTEETRRSVYHSDSGNGSATGVVDLYLDRDRSRFFRTSRSPRDLVLRRRVARPPRRQATSPQHNPLHPTTPSESGPRIPSVWDDSTTGARISRSARTSPAHPPRPTFVGRSCKLGRRYAQPVEVAVFPSRSFSLNARSSERLSRVDLVSSPAPGDVRVPRGQVLRAARRMCASSWGGGRFTARPRARTFVHAVRWGAHEEGRSGSRKHRSGSRKHRCRCRRRLRPSRTQGGGHQRSDNSNSIHDHHRRFTHPSIHLYIHPSVRPSIYLSLSIPFTVFYISLQARTIYYLMYECMYQVCTEYVCTYTVHSCIRRTVVDGALCCVVLYL
ncbi:hypothetical protein DFH06DRAFT_1203104 [Mycena polygramma]|nr:hypothetical protein DFH06DRAFT_1203104 [Mycena polygramma]